MNLLYVLGRSRVGKGQLISTAVFSSGGQEIDISSDRLTSHTSVHRSYEAFGMHLTDTVGYDDSNQMSENAMLRLLADTSKDPFYPPLIIVQTLAATDKAWIEKFVQIFPKVVFAIRCQPSTFDTKQQELGRYNPLKIFLLNEFLDEISDPSGRSRELYTSSVNEILDYYKTLTPSREDIDFDSTLFQGEFEKTSFGWDYKAENRVESKVIKQTVMKQYTETQIQTVTRTERDKFLGISVGKTTYTQQIPVQVVVEKPEEVPYEETKTYRDTYKREKFEVYKKLVGGTKIYKGEEYGGWKKNGTELIDTVVSCLE